MHFAFRTAGFARFMIIVTPPDFQIAFGLQKGAAMAQETSGPCRPDDPGSLS
jgi:hypothetical protein